MVRHSPNSLLPQSGPDHDHRYAIGSAVGLGLPPATYKHFKINLSNLLSFSSFLLLWSYWFFWVICPEDGDNNRTRLGDAVLDFYKVHRPFRIL
jgi:hypothetical protein